MHSMRSTLMVALTAVVVVGCENDPPTEPADRVEELVASVRNATAAYQQIDVAVADGFAEASPCVASPDGAMGFHYLRPDLVDAVVEATQPELLLFEPTAGGGKQLVGVEYMVMAPDWDASNGSAPELLGHAFADHRAEEARHGIPFPHYDLHLWAWRPNPDGTFEPFNPNVSCDAAG
jgi:hypothetical protein